MRLEFSYTLDDLQEAMVPEALASDPRAFRRRSPMSKLLSGLAVLIFLTFAIVVLSNLVALRSPSGEPIAENTEELWTELLTTTLPALLVVLLLAGFTWKSWRKSKWRSHASQPKPARSSRGRMQIFLTLFFLAIIVFTALFLTVPPIIWHPSHRQLLAVRLGPWAATLFLLIVVAANGSWQIRQQWFAKPSFARPKVLELDESGFHLSDALVVYHFAWGAFLRARETPNLLILVAEDKLQWMIPKRAFSSDVELERARALIQNMIPVTNFLVGPTGFPIAALVRSPD